MRPDFIARRLHEDHAEGAGIEYRPVKPVNRIAQLERDSQFPLTRRTEARLRSIVSEAFKTANSRNRRNFSSSSEPGPDVLTIWGGLVDVVSYVPPDPMGRGNIYLASVGEATLVIEIRDSESNAVLVRIIDRRAAA